MAGKEDAISAYCANLAATYERLAEDLAIPLIDRELYSCLFVQPLLRERVAVTQGSSAEATTASASTLSPNASTMDHYGDALVALGGTELLLTALREHEQQTLLVMQAMALRESVVTRMWACSSAYDNGKANIEDAQFTMLRLLQEHQMVTLLTVELVVAWRHALSRPYPFLLRNGENYLMNILQDGAAFGVTALVRSLAHLHLERDPLCSKIDLRRLLRRLQIKHRTRLVSSGAMWNLGLQPLRCITSSPPPNGSAGDSFARAAPKTETLMAMARSSSNAASETHGSLPSARYYAETSVDFLTEVKRLAAALDRVGDRQRAPLPLSSAAASTSSTMVGVSSKSVTTAVQHYPTLPLSRGFSEMQQQKQQRLLAATRVLEREASVQRMLIEELYNVAHQKRSFVPLLEAAQLFNRPEHGQVDTHTPADSWPLEKTAWPSLATTERRVNRLVCMSAAREALLAKQLLPAWERRMSNNMADLDITSGTQSMACGAPASSLLEGSRMPLQPTPTEAARRCFIKTANSSRYSDSFEGTNGTSSGTSRPQYERTNPPGERAVSPPRLGSPSPLASSSFSSRSVAADAAALAAAPAGASSPSSSPPRSSSASSVSSSASAPSRKPSLEELRHQLLAERRLSSPSADAHR
ncbi:hypothetical protein LSCM1_01912 [Leishmania martiniquensis]|uniref:Uncharacterized protein n=1 Tax=Leishmania martiniquensis TaxID=1580590 RepID=A0A836H4D6_9TRYP|nr:hypothetical protein LSCM1_01912 [Leishmania martiniquensis]